MPGRERVWRPRPPSIAELLAVGHRPLFSFEFFPPKDEIQQRQLWQTVRELESLGPDFVSVTYGASGTTRERTIRATEAIAMHTTLRSMAHLTCASQSRDELRRVIGSYAAAGIHHVLAIRGDMPGGPRVDWEPHPEGLDNATELVALVHELGSSASGLRRSPTRIRSGMTLILMLACWSPRLQQEPVSRSLSCSSPQMIISPWSVESGPSAANFRSFQGSCRSPMSVR